MPIIAIAATALKAISAAYMVAQILRWYHDDTATIEEDSILAYDGPLFGIDDNGDVVVVRK
jgi:hypothetical protein